MTLQQLNDELDCGKTIARSTHQCSPYSAYHNKTIIYSACGYLLLQKLLQTQKIGFSSIKKNALFDEKIAKTRILKIPENIEFLPLLLHFARKFFYSRWPRNKKIQWYLAVKKQDNNIQNFVPNTFIIPPKDRLYADHLSLQIKQLASNSFL